MDIEKLRKLAQAIKRDENEIKSMEIGYCVTKEWREMVKKEWREFNQFRERMGLRPLSLGEFFAESSHKHLITNNK